MNKFLLIGSGQCGSRLAQYYSEQYNYNDVLHFNSADDNKNIKDVILLKDNNNQIDGSGRNPKTTIENIIPENEILIKDTIIKKIENNNISHILLFNSLGGGTGSALNYYIMKNILISLKNENKIQNIYSIIIFGFEYEGNPVNSNQIAMLSWYMKLSNDVTLIPFQNDIVYRKDEKTTYGTTNEFICDHVFKMLDFNCFIGTSKENNLGSLDKNEFIRMTSPMGGFLTYNEIYDNDLEKITSFMNNFDVSTAKSLIIMFRTKLGEAVDINILNKISEKFPLKKHRIIAESLYCGNKSYIEILANGMRVPNKIKVQTNKIVRQINKNKMDIKKDRRKFKKIMKVKGGLNKLLDI